MVPSNEMSERTDRPRVAAAWGTRGLEALLSHCDVVVIVDVLSFSTAVDVAVGRGALILPYPYDYDDAADYAAANEAVLARPRDAAGGEPSLSPRSLSAVAPGTRILLPSPNGSSLSRLTGPVPTLTGCLRNASAVGRAAASLGKSIAVVAAGERWPDGSLRPAIEDLLGAGAIIDRIPGCLSPDAEAMCAGYRVLQDRIAPTVRDSQSGQELIQAGFADDVTVAVEIDVSRATPLLRDGAYWDAAIGTTEPASSRQTR